jgi:predicted nuclease of predicted toxin-antitoxin system
VEDVGLREANDDVIWTYATTNQYALITKDEDFVEKYRRREGGPILLWLRTGNASNRALISWLMPLLPQLMERLNSGDRFIEVR